MSANSFSKKIIDWYEENKRSLPWRLTRDPYKVWLSEIILQQTRIAQGLPYYLSFEKNFPDVKSLARAPQDKVLRLWQGLGYYSRARNLHACAKKIVTDYNGQFPTSYNELKELPGVGSYTAAAIASISFHEPVAVVDGNVFRVLARVFGIDINIASNEGKKYFFAKANELIPFNQPDVFNQAIMEFGALQCTPQNPKCESCPFNRICIANQRNLQKLLPVKSPKQKVKKRYFTYLVINHDGKFLMRKRKAGDIWNGLYDFYLIESKRQQKPTDIIKSRKELAKLIVEAVSDNYKHVLSHQQLNTRFVSCSIKTLKSIQSILKTDELKLYSKKQIEKLPKPILINRFLKESGVLE
jgi:A/G-specific adenine glycosylase